MNSYTPEETARKWDAMMDGIHARHDAITNAELAEMLTTFVYKTTPQQREQGLVRFAEFATVICERLRAMDSQPSDPSAIEKLRELVDDGQQVGLWKDQGGYTVAAAHYGYGDTLEVAAIAAWRASK
jgi:hypothetical protein